MLSTTGCNGCASYSYGPCYSNCNSGCSSCPYGKYSAASTSLVAPHAVAEPPDQPMPEHRACRCTRTTGFHATTRAPSHTSRRCVRARAGTGTHVCNSDGTITSATCTALPPPPSPLPPPPPSPSPPPSPGSGSSCDGSWSDVSPCALPPVLLPFLILPCLICCPARHKQDSVLEVQLPVTALATTAVTCHSPGTVGASAATGAAIPAAIFTTGACTRSTATLAATAVPVSTALLASTALQSTSLVAHLPWPSRTFPRTPVHRFLTLARTLMVQVQCRRATATGQ